jgi:hypothetical protein
MCIQTIVLSTATAVRSANSCLQLHIRHDRTGPNIPCRGFSAHAPPFGCTLRHPTPPVASSYVSPENMWANRELVDSRFVWGHASVCEPTAPDHQDIGGREAARSTAPSSHSCPHTTSNIRISRPNPFACGCHGAPEGAHCLPIGTVCL